MKRLLSSWQGLLAGLTAVFVFIGSGPVLRWLDPTAGVFDAGFLQWIVLASVVYLWGIFMTWIGFQIAFKSLDILTDTPGWLAGTFLALPPWLQYLWIQGCFILMGIAWLVCLKLVLL